MPNYTYRCDPCGCDFDVFYKLLPSEKKQKEAPCPDCDAIGRRLLGPFLIGNTQSSGIEKAMGHNALTLNVGGREMPAFQDNDGRLHEVRRKEDIDRWKSSNQYGSPRMVKWKNQKTGETSMVPLRMKMVADPVSGEPLDAPVVRESAKMVEIDHFEMPTETKTGIPIDPNTGVPKIRDYSKIPLGGPGRRLIDPETGKPLTLGNCWGDQPTGVSDKSYVKAVLGGARDGAGKK